MGTMPHPACGFIGVAIHVAELTTVQSKMLCMVDKIVIYLSYISHNISP